MVSASGSGTFAGRWFEGAVGIAEADHRAAQAGRRSGQGGQGAPLNLNLSPRADADANPMFKRQANRASSIGTRSDWAMGAFVTAKIIAPCWMCGDAGTTGEHKTKRTDLRTVFGTPTQDEPLYYHDANRSNQLVRSLDAKILKSPARICASCNNARTQPHDRAWEVMSAWLFDRQPTIKAGDIIRANRIFTYNTKQNMLGVHLYFLKLFGCMVVEAGPKIPIDIQQFADAILKTRAHPFVYLKFTHGPETTGRSELHLECTEDRKHVFSTWLYQVGWLTVIVMFATPSEKQRKGLFEAWHPKFGSNRLVIADLSAPIGKPV